jgi:glycosyltransferase involved in cell wall biosynthesis
MKNALIIILYDHPWEHTADYATQTGNYFCTTNFVIGILLKDSRSLKELLVNPLSTSFWKRRAKNFYTVTPIFFIPFRRFNLICHMNNLLNILFIKIFAFIALQVGSFSNKIVWVFNPEHHDEAYLLKGEGLLVYDCVDYHPKTHVSIQERNLLQTSNYVFVNSTVLYDLYHPFKTSIHMVPLGFDDKSFQRQQNKIKQPSRADGSVIGYIGGINSRLNYRLIQKVASICPHLKFVFIGPLQYHEKKDTFETKIRPQISALFHLKNVSYLGAVPKYAIGEYIQQFSVCMIPYDVSSPFNKNCFPMKVLEYFYFGKPVISTPIRELKKYSSYIHLENTPLLWKRSIDQLLSSKWSVYKQKEQRTIAISNSWENKFRKICTIMDDASVV